MNIHKHVRLTFIRRLEMVQQLFSKRLTVTGHIPTTDRHDGRDAPVPLPADVRGAVEYGAPPPVAERR